MIVELLRPAGADLARRWLAALLLVPEPERPAVVAAIESRIAATYPAQPPLLRPEAAAAVDDPATPAPSATRAGPARRPAPRTVQLVGPPRQRPGYVEQVHRTYEVLEGAAAPANPGAAPAEDAPPPAAGKRSKPRRTGTR
ncbi:MAG TPA: hypothetical protein VD963_02745 [Phycisphaerales bacterium]|nr:hypothetical protein [Phycisphaerales bacterium]